MQRISDKRLAQLAERVGETLNEAALNEKDRGTLAANDSLLNAVRDEEHLRLSMSRRAYAELVRHVEGGTICVLHFYLLVSFAELTKEEGFHQLGATLAYTYGRGYHYSLKADKAHALPASAIQRVHNRVTTTFTTLDMIKYNGSFIVDASGTKHSAVC